MRPLSAFSRAEWLRLAPLDERFRRLRNKLLMAVHRRRRAPGQDALIARLSTDCADRPLAVTVAFNTPPVVAVWIARMRRLVPGSVLLVCDNSDDPAARAAIAALCRGADVGYLPIPPLPVRLRRNGSRSHGMAMTWIYHGLVAAVRPPVFAFLDHDLFPVAPTDLAALVADQPVYGLGSAAIADPGRPWALWAGLCLFRFAAVAGRPLDFTPDHLIGLDSGGQNWHRLYRHLDRTGFRFARRTMVAVGQPRVALERIDGFVHLGDAARRFARGESFATLERLLDEVEGQTAASPRP